jgi:hydrogenase maturation protein HypF
MSDLKSARVHITGIVQGVGFRPFVYNLARSLQLTGWVRNTSAGVDIEIDGAAGTVDQFIQSLRTEAPPLAHIDQIDVVSGPPNGFSSFEIIHSEPIPGAFQPISPDVAICPDCLEELFDPNNRRYRYPFINCTNCGPRLTIITDIPYDRPNTTMASFPMCPDCAAEYSNPQDRRFHAQPIACPTCGPEIWLEQAGNKIAGPETAIPMSQQLLARNKILAIKGLGGFHLACDATKVAAVIELRRRKLRVDKPFALMMADMETIRKHCFVSAEEEALLESYQRPIVILRRRPKSSIAAEVAPHQETLGVMMPYTPLHYLLFAPSEASNGGGSTLNALVMTSGNLSEEPIAFENDEARQRLSSLADAFLMHNRPIRTRCDDSLARITSRYTPEQSVTSVPKSSVTLYPLRRSRGYSPMPIRLPWETVSLLATGAELKNAFCLARDHYAILSHHIGDMENYETLQSFEDGIAHYERLFRIHPTALAYDLHPNYLATRYALARAQQENLPTIGIQHHHAHIAACMGDNGLEADDKVIGVSFDGTGYGDDGAIWGGEFFVASYLGYQRVAHLAYVPLPGGDMAIRNPARIALAQLWQAGMEWDTSLQSVQALCAEERMSIHSQLVYKINTPLTSSMGRLFDGIASIVGVCQNANYEAQAAIELEALVDLNERKAYEFDYKPDLSNILPSMGQAPILIDPIPLVKSVIHDLRQGASQGMIAARFHNGVAEMVCKISMTIRNMTGFNTVALSGGVWQNMTLLNKTTKRLGENGFEVLTHHQVPTNDGGLALGQIMVAAANIIAGNI